MPIFAITVLEDQITEAGVAGAPDLISRLKELTDEEAYIAWVIYINASNAAKHPPIDPHYIGDASKEACTDFEGKNSSLVALLKKAGAEVLAISTDSVFSHRAWINTPEAQGGLGPVKYVLASDITKDVSRDYGVLIEDKGIALRGLFIIDQDGVLQYQVVHGLNIGRSVDETLRVLEALKTSGLCAADWKPGQKPLSV